MKILPVLYCIFLSNECSLGEHLSLISKTKSNWLLSSRKKIESKEVKNKQKV